MAGGLAASAECHRLLEALRLEIDRVCEQNKTLAEQNPSKVAPPQDVALGGKQAQLQSTVEIGAAAPLDLDRLPAARSPKAAPVTEVTLRIPSKEGQCPTQSLSDRREILNEFHKLCKEGKETLSAQEIFDMDPDQGSAAFAHRPAAIKSYKHALRAINESIVGARWGEWKDVDLALKEELQAGTYAALSQDASLLPGLGLSNIAIGELEQIQHVINNYSLTHSIAVIIDLEHDDVHKPHVESRFVQVLFVLDVLSASVILLNTATLTMSLDYASGWAGWEVFEAIFTCFFLLEILVRVGLSGIRAHFCDTDWAWNFFDIIVVVTGLSGLLLQLVQASGSDTTQISAMRVLRLCRIGKLVRVLRFKAFKELRVITQGLFFALRTLLWAFVFLFVFHLLLAIVTRQFLASEPDSMPCNDNITFPWGCDSSKDHLKSKAREQLFGTVWRCMFTIFRCFVSDGCTTTDGHPLMPVLWDQFGIVVPVLYVLCFCFLTFGLFNLIMATIVESTVEAGKHDAARNRRRHRTEHLQTARSIRSLVTFLCSDDSFKPQLTSNPSSQKDVGMRGMLERSISKKQFLHMLEDPAIHELLEELGIANTDPCNYVEAIDANEDGHLSMAELIRGLMRLRGTVEKSDVVATLNVARHMQKSLKQVEAMLERQHYPDEIASV